ncbi:hypothetical protein FSP39_015149 [Pinctada imbricata]|uniref:Uncharacterized protein n=1 Tax=Pinctada imbricata TaxID=66713 RepID=A0AA89C5G8_PINIB|nr:hypothetical protein FSP39_015149 [Pinctada imbricata]
MAIKQILNDVDLVKELKEIFSKTNQVSPEKCSKNSQYRTYDGSCNNLANPTWGMAGQTQLRMMPAEYNDGISEPRILGNDGNPLPSPRMVSNIVHREGKKRQMSKTSSVMVMQWGQFLDHDIVATPLVRNDDGSPLVCCGNTTTTLGDDDRNVDDIDIYSGGISEKSMPGAEVGPLFGCLLAEQFRKLKFGDRFWYDRQNDQIGFTEGISS